MGMLPDRRARVLSMYFSSVVKILLTLFGRPGCARAHSSYLIPPPRKLGPVCQTGVRMRPDHVTLVRRVRLFIYVRIAPAEHTCLYVQGNSIYGHIRACYLIENFIIRVSDVRARTFDGYVYE